MIGNVIGRVLLALLLLFLLLAVSGTAAHAAGLVDDTVDAANEYSKYPLDNYQLDFYVDSGWDWLPWNWLDAVSYTHLLKEIKKLTDSRQGVQAACEAKAAEAD